MRKKKVVGENKLKIVITRFIIEVYVYRQRL